MRKVIEICSSLVFDLLLTNAYLTTQSKAKKVNHVIHQPYYRRLYITLNSFCFLQSVQTSVR